MGADKISNNQSVVMADLNNGGVPDRLTFAGGELIQIEWGEDGEHRVCKSQPCPVPIGKGKFARLVKAGDTISNVDGNREEIKVIGISSLLHVAQTSIATTFQTLDGKTFSPLFYEIRAYTPTSSVQLAKRFVGYQVYWQGRTEEVVDVEEGLNSKFESVHDAVQVISQLLDLAISCQMDGFHAVSLNVENNSYFNFTGSALGDLNDLGFSFFEKKLHIYNNKTRTEVIVTDPLQIFEIAYKIEQLSLANKSTQQPMYY